MAESWKECLEETPEGVLLRVRVQPRASREETVGLQDGRLKVRVTAPPAENAANEALLRFLAKKLGCARGRISLVKGAKGRAKTVLALGIGAREAAARLGLSASKERGGRD
ncbi:MAG: YggU family protein [Verrucomicrobia bacterium]|nr:YggU family protein [Verrucomicrobiota bacterium]